MTQQFFDCMLDAETMGKAPDGALIQIGAVFFDLHTQTLGPTFLENISLADAVRHGGTLDPSTIIWWLGQPDKARESIRFGGGQIAVVLGRFADWIKETCRHEDVRMWGNSPNFDLAIVGGAYDRLGMTRPWYWTNERDFRTVRHQHPSVEYNTDDKGEDAHNALADAIFQAKHLMKIKASVRRA